MYNSWGFLGNPSKQQVSEWQSLPFGHFHKMIEEQLSRKNEHAVFVVEKKMNLRTIVVRVQAHNYEEAIKTVKEIPVSDFDWTNSSNTNHIVTYEYSGGVKTDE